MPSPDCQRSDTQRTTRRHPATSIRTRITTRRTNPVTMLFFTRKRRIWLAVAMAAVVLFPVVGYLGFGAFKTWRAENLAATAMELLQSGQKDAVQEAWEIARAAHRLRPENIEVVRTVARVYLVVDPAASAGFWEQAVRLSNGDFEDYDGWVEATVKASDFDAAGAVLEQMEQAYPGHLEVQVRRIQFHVAKGTIDQALDQARQAMRHDQADAEHAFLFIDITQLATNPSIRRAGIEHLRALADSDDSEVALRAARRLGRMEGITSSDLLHAARMLDKHAVSPEDRLLRLELLLAQGREKPADIARLAVEEFDTADASQLVDFGRWLNSMGLHAQTLQHIPAAQALRRQDLFLVYLDALAMTDQWAEIEALLKQQDAPLTPVFEELFRMRTFWERGETRRAEIAWGRTLLAAGRDPESLWFIAQYTLRLGLLNFSAEALETMAEQPALKDTALAGLLEVYREQKNSPALRSTLQRMHAQAPGNDAVTNDLAYFNLLMGENPAAAKETAESQMEAFPLRLAPKMTYVLALYREGRAREALAFLETIPVDWNEASFRWRIVVASILAANGDEERAFEFIRDHPMHSLFPEERVMLQNAGLL